MLGAGLKAHLSGFRTLADTLAGMVTSSEDGASARHFVSVEELTDPNAASGEVLSQDIIDLGSNPFRARRVTIVMERCIVIVHSTNSRVRAQTALPAGRMGFMATGEESRATLDGRPVAPELMLVVEAGAQAQLVVDRGYVSVSCLLPPEQLESELRARQRLDEFLWPKGVEFRRPDWPCVREFFDIGVRLADAAVQDPPSFEASGTLRASAELDVLEALMAAANTAVPAEPSRSDRTHLDYGQVVKSSQQYALRHSPDRVYVSDLCRAAHVSERTLQNAFRETTGMTPVGYLTRVRLHRARRALANAIPGSTTVTAVAMDWGFWHMGEFSRLYKDCFGDLPSETLRRTPVK